MLDIVAASPLVRRATQGRASAHAIAIAPAQHDAILALLFPKKKDPDEAERPVINSIIIAIGKLNPHLAFTELLQLLARARSAGLTPLSDLGLWPHLFGDIDGADAMRFLISPAKIGRAHV